MPADSMFALSTALASYLGPAWLHASCSIPCPRLAALCWLLVLLRSPWLLPACPSSLAAPPRRASAVQAALAALLLLLGRLLLRPLLLGPLLAPLKAPLKAPLYSPM